MSQQINLFEGGLVNAKDWFTLKFVAVVYVLAAGVMYYLFTGLEAENAQLQVQRTQAVAQYESMQQKVNEFSQRVTPVDNSKLEAALKNLKGRLEMQSQILAIFQQSISEAANHLVDYMRALTAQQQAGLWLTGFKIEPAAQHVTLSGQALQSEDIPSYLDLLSAQYVFAGTQFSGIQFKQVELHKNQPATPVSAPSASASAPTTTTESAPASKDSPGATGGNPPAVPVTSTPPVTATAPVQEVTLKVYAFEVKGQDMQSQAKHDTGVSWDEFVRQTTQPQAVPRP